MNSELLTVKIPVIFRPATVAKMIRDALTCLLLPWLVAMWCAPPRLEAAETNTVASAMASITVDDLERHVEVLADDTFEGREAGSRGGLAAGGYLAKEFKKLGLEGGGSTGGYFQSFGPQYRNLLGLLPGSDPELAKQVIVVGAHYDHVGYGTPQNSFGPTGYIHNGADDNASGTAGLLEAAQAFVQLEPRPKRTILFALWDGEEKGLLGSQHWVAHPTLPLSRVRIMLNMDMIGRLSNDKIEVYGARSSIGLRRLVSLCNDQTNLLVNFSWVMREDSDHYSFYQRGTPVLMLHTGLHSDYHRPSDDVEKLNPAGMQRVVRLLFWLVHELAERPESPAFRAAIRRESGPAREQVERALPPLPGRLGVRWNSAGSAQGGAVLTGVNPASPAFRAGLRSGDRIVGFAGREILQGSELASLVLSATSPVTIDVVRLGTADLLHLTSELEGRPIRLGVSWRIDDAEPDTAIIKRVVPASPAERGGLKVQDRIYDVSGHSFQSSEEFGRLLDTIESPLELLVERMGRLERKSVPLPSEQ